MSFSRSYQAVELIPDAPAKVDHAGDRDFVFRVFAGVERVGRAKDILSR